MSAKVFVHEQILGKRRSRRIKIQMPVGIVSADPSPDSKPIRATAINLNRHGALLSLDRELKVGSQILLTNPKREKALARVVWQVNRQTLLRQYGIEFIDSNCGATFWGVTFIDQGKV